MSSVRRFFDRNPTSKPTTGQPGGISVGGLYTDTPSMPSDDGGGAQLASYAGPATPAQQLVINNVERSVGRGLFNENSPTRRAAVHNLFSLEVNKFVKYEAPFPQIFIPTSLPLGGIFYYYYGSQEPVAASTALTLLRMERAFGPGIAWLRSPGEYRLYLEAGAAQTFIVLDATSESAVAQALSIPGTRDISVSTATITGAAVATIVEASSTRKSLMIQNIGAISMNVSKDAGTAAIANPIVLIGNERAVFEGSTAVNHGLRGQLTAAGSQSVTVWQFF